MKFLRFKFWTLVVLVLVLRPSCLMCKYILFMMQLLIKWIHNVVWHDFLLFLLFEYLVLMRLETEDMLALLVHLLRRNKVNFTWRWNVNLANFALRILYGWLCVCFELTTVIFNFFQPSFNNSLVDSWVQSHLEVLGHLMGVFTWGCLGKDLLEKVDWVYLADKQFRLFH